MKIFVVVVFVAFCGTLIEARTLQERALKDDLLVRAGELVKLAEKAIANTTVQKDTELLAKVKAQEAKIQSLIADLKATSDETKIKAIEQQIVEFEADELKHRLLKRVNILLEKADQTIAKLEKDKNTEMLTKVKEERAKIQALVGSLNVTKDLPKLHDIEKEVVGYETRLAEKEKNATTKAPSAA